MPTFDLVIAGGSFAGLACARAAATLGLSTAVLERKRDAGEGVRTTGILVQEAADEVPVPRRLTRAIRGVRLYSRSLASIDLESPGYAFLATDTPDLLRWLAAEGRRAGAALFLGRPYSQARREEGQLDLGGGLRARFLVGADGARSRVARDFGLGRNRRFLAGVELEYEGVRGVDPDRLHCFLDARLAPGYIAWVVPGVGLTQVGVAAALPRRPDLQGFLAVARRLFDFSAARLVSRRAGLIPVGGPVRPLSTKNVLLLGDASGAVSPLTGGGIHSALHLGQRVARFIADHLLDGGIDPGAALSQVMPVFSWKRRLRVLFQALPADGAVDILLASRVFRAVAQAVFFHHRGFLSAAPWRDLLLGSPARERSAARMHNDVS
jgi:flavin-dependent dehydrogenase